MPAWPKASKSTTRTISTGSRSWRLPTRVCSRATAALTFRQYRTSQSRSMSTLTSLLIPAGVVVAMTITLGPATLFAHDLWIEPTTFSPQPGQIVGVRLRVGQDLLGDPVPRDPALVNQLVFEDAGGRKPLVGRDGADPAGFLRVAQPGLLVIGYLSNASAVALPPEKFNQYLKDEGLDEVAALRARRKQTGDTAHELFSRCAKSLMLSGSPSR